MLFGKYGEFVRCEIYFVLFDEFNDLFEGYVDVLWYGDVIFWMSLFWYYFFVLIYVVIMVVFIGVDFNLVFLSVVVELIDEDLLEGLVCEIYVEVCLKFFVVELLVCWIVMLMDCDFVFFCEELVGFLCFFYFLVFYVVFCVFDVVDMLILFSLIDFISGFGVMVD